MYTLTPIGMARTPFPAGSRIPREGAGPAAIEVDPEFEACLDGIERASHLWIIAFLPSAERVKVARTRRAAAGDPPCGVFGMRSPARPNPIGLTAARLLARSGRRIEVDRLDLFDGTPVLDLKPYSPGWDLIPSAASSHPYDPSRYELHELTEAFERVACNALGPHALQRVTVDRLIHALTLLVSQQRLDIRSACLSFEISAADERVELLLCATGASFGNGRLGLASHDPLTLLVAKEAGGRLWRCDHDPATGRVVVRSQ
jgi:tRNA (adenine37-N6)-methyltransferase